MDNKPKRILLLGATFGTDNMGVGALTAGALGALIHRDPDARICFLDYGVNSTVSETRVEGRAIRVPLINLRFSWKIFLPNNVAYLLVVSALLRFSPRSLRDRIVGNNRWLKAIYEADSALAVSGGDSFSDIYGMGRFFYVVLPQILLVMLGKNLSLLPQTIGPFKGRLPKHLARFVMHRAQTIYSRDVEGTHEARKLLGLRDGDPKVRFCYDLGFVVEPHKPERMDLGGMEHTARTRPVVGLNVSGLLLIGGYERNNAFGLNVDYRKLVGSIIDFLVEVKGADVLLVPHVFGTHEESDTAAVNAIFKEFGSRHPGHLFRVQGTYNQNEIKHIIGLCDFFIGARMHACIAALSQSIPAIAIAYSRKFIGVLESIGAGHLVADPRRLSTEDILRLIDTSFTERREIRSHLQATMAGVRRAVLDVAVDFA
jgi:colanic acid/amylovoran biosynthesis protein